MADKIQVAVRIGGIDYKIVGDADSAHIHHVANLVDERFQQIREGNSRLTITQAAIMAAVTIADDYICMERDYLKLTDMLKNSKTTGIKNPDNWKVVKPVKKS